MEITGVRGKGPESMLDGDPVIRGEDVKARQSWAAALSLNLILNPNPLG
jgi:hypothetical protein